MLALWRFIAVAQQEGLSQLTAYGAHKKAGGNASAAYFSLLWNLAKRDPFRQRGLA